VYLYRLQGSVVITVGGLMNDRADVLRYGRTA
jgi:hypothetical protein